MGAENLLRLRVVIRGAVQGVGFRPFVYRLATGMGLTGWVVNSSQGVFIEVEGERSRLEAFLLRLEPEKPPASFIHSLESSFLDAAGFDRFEILASEESGEKTVLVLPDLATCADCREEIFDPGDRRYGYPFTNCTNCGPRYSIIQALPYDRPNTTMAAFPMCNECRREYEDPSDRRFHAQPNACPSCGPHIELWDREGKPLASDHAALLSAAVALRTGSIIAVKGLGGYHLMADARDEDAVRTLRQRKHREEKPLALLFPSLRAVRECCEVSALEERLLRSPESPIVLLRRRPDAGPSLPLTPGPSPARGEGSPKLETFGSVPLPRPLREREGPGEGEGYLRPIAPSVAPRNPHLGVMLPYTPLHHLLMAELGFPVVATSGNLSDEPICTDESEALERLGGIADLFLVHNRPIARHVDDSIVRVMLDREIVLRRARGYAPLPVHREEPGPPMLAVGAHLKNAVAASVGPDVFISQHIGDLETAAAYEAFRKVILSFEELYAFRPRAVACDLHPDYLSTQFAVASGLPTVSVQHHVAHAIACMAENGLEGPVLAVSWDGTGYGTDGTIWGGEFFVVVRSDWRRVAHFRTFPLPGGEKGVKEPRRAALGALYEIGGQARYVGRGRSDGLASPAQAWLGGEIAVPARSFLEGAFRPSELKLLRGMLDKGINSPRTSSAGRLFDMVSALAGLRSVVRFEGQGAMELEFALDGLKTGESYDILVREDDGTGGSAERPMILDWEPMVRQILEDIDRDISLGLIAARFHNALAEAIVAVARLAGQERVVLTGGCFQNRYLTERAVERLRDGGFRPYWHQRIPPNDGGIALGQAIAARWALEKG